MSEYSSKVTISNDRSAQCCPPPPPPPPPPHTCPSDCSQQDYVLSDGADVHLDAGKEVNHDFVLNPNPHKNCGTLSGIVRDKNGHPIENALVKVFDDHHAPVAHVFTNREGQFLICLPPGHYIVKAVR